MEFPLFIMSQLIRTQMISHRKEIITTKELYNTLELVTELLEEWNSAQYKKPNPTNTEGDSK